MEVMPEVMKTLFLNPPSYEGFDGGAGARYQARREIKSFWYPTWLAQPAAMVPGSRLIDAPPDGLTVEQVAPLAKDYELAVLHTSTPSFANDAKFAAHLKEVNPKIMIGMVGAHVGVLPMQSMNAAPAVDWVAVGEFDYICADVAARKPLKDVGGLAYRDNGRVSFTPPRPTIENMNDLPFVVDVYKRDLTIENYFIGYLKHPYVSFYTGRGCRSKCTFCLWPQTVGGHRYRVRSAENVLAEVRWIKENMPEVKEIMFDDDTFTDTSNLPRVEAIARGMGELGMTWSCNAKANVPYRTLRVMRDNGLRLLLVGYESGNQQILNNIKKGIRLDIARQFTGDCRDLGITIHGTFILGLPGETRETIQETIRYATEINPHTIQVSIAAPYPGTYMHRQALENGWLKDDGKELVNEHGVQLSALSYVHLPHTEIFDSVEMFYKRFYFRPRKVASLVSEMVRSPQMLTRRLREGVEFFRFLAHR